MGGDFPAFACLFWKMYHFLYVKLHFSQISARLGLFYVNTIKKF